MPFVKKNYSKILANITLVVVSVLIFNTNLNAEKKAKPSALPPSLDPRGEVELTICSQNLNNYGLPAETKKRLGLDNAELSAKEAALIKRFTSQKCDVIAVQEILSKNEEVALKVLQQLADGLKRESGRFFIAKTGSSEDPSFRNGFLVAKDRAEVLNVLSYTRVELPKLTPKQKPRKFARGPLEIQLAVKSKGEGRPRNVTIINFHFKSKSGAAGDPAGLEWETYRMEMSEALRRIIETRHSRSLTSAENILVVLGDRNSNFDQASAKILEGTITLKNFQDENGCRLSKRGVPLCKSGMAISQVLFSVLTDDPQTKQMSGTHRYKKVYSWIDDILMPSESIKAAWATYDIAGDYDSGVVYKPSEASDHAMTYVRLNW